MSRTLSFTAMAGVSLFLAACGGGGSKGGAAPVSVTRAPTATVSQMGTTALPPSRVEVSRNGADRVQFTFTDGPLKDMIVICADHAGAACTVVGGPDGTTAQGTLEGRMAGQHAYAGSLQILHNQDGALQRSFHRLYQAAPSTSPSVMPALPTGLATYTGAFMGGAGVGTETGIAEGGITLTVNFNSARLSGVMGGSMRGTGTPVTASFNNVTIAPGTGQFASDTSSTFLFNNLLGGGRVQGGFYGPNANEAAGVFELGSTAGGMSGIFLGCAGATASCVTHAQ